MNIFKDYIEYINDNPEQYWFKRKLYGYGWIPATKQGWLVLVVYLTFVLGLAVYAQSGIEESQVFAIVLIPILLATGLFLTIVWKTGESLRWQWGDTHEK